MNKILLLGNTIFMIATIVLASVVYTYHQRLYPVVDYNEESMVAKLEKLMLIPEDEEPFIGKINDVQKLKQENPQFYGDAEIGDAVVLLKDKAIIYRPSENKIINVFPVVAD